MTDVTQILSQIESGDPSAADQLLPLVYEELRKLAATKMANERPGQTLQATALVHEAYVRLVSADKSEPWNGRGHFFAAAAETMRRILVEQARRKLAKKRGGDGMQVSLEPKWFNADWQWFVGVNKGELTTSECRELLVGVGVSLQGHRVGTEVPTPLR